MAAPVCSKINKGDHFIYKKIVLAFMLQIEVFGLHSSISHISPIFFGRYPVILNWQVGVSADTHIEANIPTLHMAVCIKSLRKYSTTQINRQTQIF